MSTPARRHRIVLDVSFDRPLELSRVLFLLDDPINEIHKLGRDLTRPGEPEAKLIRASLKRLNMVITAENRRVGYVAPNEEALRRVIREELAAWDSNQ